MQTEGATLSSGARVDVLAVMKRDAADASRYRCSPNGSVANSVADTSRFGRESDQARATIEAMAANVRALLASAPAHMCPRNAAEREAYKALRADLIAFGTTPPATDAPERTKTDPLEGGMDLETVRAVFDEVESWLPYDGDDNRIRERFAQARASVVIEKGATPPAGGKAVGYKIRDVVERAIGQPFGENTHVSLGDIAAIINAYNSAPPAGGGDADEPADPWRPINELPDSDDLYWFMRGDTIDGPRAPQRGGFDADEWEYFAPCEAPSRLASSGGA